MSDDTSYMPPVYYNINFPHLPIKPSQTGHILANCPESPFC